MNVFIDKTPLNRGFSKTYNPQMAELMLKRMNKNIIHKNKDYKPNLINYKTESLIKNRSVVDG